MAVGRNSSKYQAMSLDTIELPEFFPRDASQTRFSLLGTQLLVKYSQKKCTTKRGALWDPVELHFGEKRGD